MLLRGIPTVVTFSNIMRDGQFIACLKNIWFRIIFGLIMLQISLAWAEVHGIKADSSKLAKSFMLMKLFRDIWLSVIVLAYAISYSGL